MNCALIGSTLIAEVHLEKLLNQGIKEIYLISRFKKKRENLLKKIQRKNISANIYASDLSILKKKKFNIIDICTKNEIHDKNLNYISGSNSIIIIEKPVISLIKFRNNYLNYLNRLYKKNKRIIVCYPYFFFAKEFNKIFKNKKKFTSLEFRLNTGGSYQYEKITENLIPHALTFINHFISMNMLDKYKIVKKSINLNRVHFKLSNGLKCLNIFLSETKGRKTFFSVKLDKKKITRITKVKNSTFLNILKYKNKEIIINNPMDELFKNIFKNLKNKKFFIDNKKLTYEIMKLSYKLIR